MTLALRDARSTDAGGVGAILSEFIDTTPWMPRIHTRAEELAFAGDLIERGWVRLAEASGDVLAFCARDAAEIHALYVHQALCGQGIGKSLLDDAKARHPNLALWTFQANTGAQRFYCREGFTETGRTDGAGNDEGLPDIRFEWQAEATT